MNKIFLFAILIFLVPSPTFCQYFTSQNKVWAFGNGAGLDFNTGVPIPINTDISAFEGSATVCSSSGSILFYTNGEFVLNALHSVMPSSFAMLPSGFTTSTTQASVIVPNIGYSGRYYIFALNSHAGTDTVGSSTSYLCYSIVDMSLGGGMGDILLPHKGIIIDSMMSEKMIAITGNDNNIWLLTHRTDSAIFYAYEITNTGINMSPVVSHIGAFNGPKSYATGVLKVSPNRRKIVSQSSDPTVFDTAYSGAGYGTELFDFDPNTGLVSNGLVLDSMGKSVYGAAFSPDNSKLYSNESTMVPYNSQLFQYDLSSGIESTIIASKSLIVSLPYAETDLKLAPDNKIYFKGTDDSMGLSGCSRYMDCINYPDLPGSSCGYVSHAVTLLPNTSLCLGLSNTYVGTDTLGYTSVSEQFAAADHLYIYPNPCSAKLSVSYNKLIDNISIRDIFEKSVYNGNFRSKLVNLDIANLPSGMYFIVINNVHGKKFLKN